MRPCDELLKYLAVGGTQILKIGKVQPQNTSIFALHYPNNPYTLFIFILGSGCMLFFSLTSSGETAAAAVS